MQRSEDRARECCSFPRPSQILKVGHKVRETLDASKTLNEVLFLRGNDFLLEIKEVSTKSEPKTAVVEYDPTRTVREIVNKNPGLEETYLALIIKMVIELILGLHGAGFFNIDCSSKNLLIKTSGIICLKNRLVLTRNNLDAMNDIESFVRFVKKLTNLEKLTEKEICISKNFKDFLQKTSNVPSESDQIRAYLETLLNSKFLHRKSNILNDLIDDLDSDLSQPFRSDSLNPSISNKLNSQDVVEGSGNSNGHRLDETTEDAKLKAQATSARMREITNEVFSKYIGPISKKNENKIANILGSIQSSLVEMEGKHPGSTLKLIKKYLKIRNL